MDGALRVHEILVDDQEVEPEPRSKRPKVELCCEMCGARPEVCAKSPFQFLMLLPTLQTEQRHYF